MFFIFSVVVSVILGVIIPENMFHPPLLSPPEWLGWAIGGGTFAVLYLLKVLVCSGVSYWLDATL